MTETLLSNREKTYTHDQQINLQNTYNLAVFSFILLFLNEFA